MIDAPDLPGYNERKLQAHIESLQARLAAMTAMLDYADIFILTHVDIRWHREIRDRIAAIKAAADGDTK